jgi:hypothetical protein
LLRERNLAGTVDLKVNLLNGKEVFILDQEFGGNDRANPSGKRLLQKPEALAEGLAGALDLAFDWYNRAGGSVIWHNRAGWTVRQIHSPSGRPYKDRFAF